jgi:phytoene synthase
MEDAFAHCERLVREADKERFLAALFAPANRRRQLFALYAFNVEMSRIRDRARDPLAGEVRLQWWYDVVAGERAGEAAGNPVAAALIQTIVRGRLPLTVLSDLIEARRFDLYDEPMQSLPQLEDYARRTSSQLLEIAGLILDGANEKVAAAALPAGIAYAMTGLLRAFPVHAARGQLYVPLDVLHRHGALPEDIFAGRDTPAIRSALAAMRERIEMHLGDYAQAAGELPAAVLPAFLPLALVQPRLKRLKRVGSFRVTDIPSWRRQFILWRAARRGGTGPRT